MGRNYTCEFKLGNVQTYISAGERKQDECLFMCLIRGKRMKIPIDGIGVYVNQSKGHSLIH